ncbi:MAG: CDP-glycerol glycerophosphotransferase family protein, partial [Spirochaetota bacterium]
MIDIIYSVIDDDTRLLARTLRGIDFSTGVFVTVFSETYSVLIDGICGQYPCGIRYSYGNQMECFRSVLSDKKNPLIMIADSDTYFSSCTVDAVRCAYNDSISCYILTAVLEVNGKKRYRNGYFENKDSSEFSVSPDMLAGETDSYGKVFLKKGCESESGKYPVNSLSDYASIVFSWCKEYKIVPTSDFVVRKYADKYNDIVEDFKSAVSVIGNIDKRSSLYAPVSRLLADLISKRVKSKFLFLADHEKKEIILLMKKGLRIGSVRRMSRRRSKILTCLCRRSAFCFMELLSFAVISKKNPVFLYNMFCRFVPVRKRQVFIESNLGNHYCDSPRVISERLTDAGGIKVIWSFADPAMHKGISGVITVRKKSLKYYYYLAASRIWLSNQAFVSHYMKKKKNQIYIQTWHGTPLKKICSDVYYTWPGFSQKRSSAWDYLIAQNRYSADIFRKAFRYDGIIYETGYPKNDFLHACSEPVVCNLRKKLNIPDGKNVCLYAPTWRDNAKTVSLEFSLSDFS